MVLDVMKIFFAVLYVLLYTLSLRVIKYVARSFKITQNDSVE